MTPAEQWSELAEAMVAESAADADPAVRFVSTALQVNRLAREAKAFVAAKR